MKKNLNDNTFRVLLFLLIAGVTVSCKGPKQNSNEPTTGLGNDKDIKLTQYIKEGQRLYSRHCSNCHQADGNGLGKLYPPLNKSDYLENNLEGSLCIIKNGKKGKIVVNGKTYNQPMPANPRLTDLEIAEIATFLYNSWGQEKGLIGVKKVTKILSNCKEN